jgi:hypothetical protein
MDMTITTNEVLTLLGALPSTDPLPNAKNIFALRLRIERALYNYYLAPKASIWDGKALPCPKACTFCWSQEVMHFDFR